jgi:hypothetical protein
VARLSGHAREFRQTVQDAVWPLSKVHGPYWPLGRRSDKRHKSSGLSLDRCSPVFNLGAPRRRAARNFAQHLFDRQDAAAALGCCRDRELA